MGRLMDALGLTEQDLEDRRGHRPTGFRVQLLMWLMVQSGMSKRRVSLLMDRDRTCVYRAIKLLTPRYREDESFRRRIHSILANPIRKAA